jgi:mannose-6-phosphate isomerase-like protein (cupin superfamily)
MKGKAVIRKQSEATEYYFAEKCFITEWSNVPDDPDLSIAQARVQPGVTTRLHRLHGITERYVILSGRGRFEADALPPQDVGPGDVVFILPMCAQRIANTGQDDLIFLALCTPRFVPEAYEDVDETGDGSPP